jgi:hypothetical protein
MIVGEYGRDQLLIILARSVVDAHPVENDVAESGSYKPESNFGNVDLPEPLPPVMKTISSDCNVKFNGPTSVGFEGEPWIAAGLTVTWFPAA